MLAGLMRITPRLHIACVLGATSFTRDCDEDDVPLGVVVTIAAHDASLSRQLEAASLNLPPRWL